MITFATVSLGAGGWPSCERCAGPTPGRPRPAAEVLAPLGTVAEEWSGGPGPNVAFTGMDAFSHPDLPQIVSGAASHGFERIRIATAGARLLEGRNAQGALSAGVRHLEFRVAGASGGAAGRAGALDDVRAAARAWLDGGRDARVRVVASARVSVCVHTLEALPTVVAELAQMGLSTVALEVDDGAMRSVRAREAVVSALDTGVVNGVWVTVDGPSPDWVPELHRIACTREVAV